MTAVAATPTSQPVKAALWMMGAMLSFSAMAVAGREMASELDTFEIMLYRSVIGLLILLTFAGWAGTLGEITRRLMGLHLLRNVCHFAGQNLWFYAVAAIPFAQLFAFEFSTPLWVAVLAAVFLKERLTKVRIASALLGFAGILIIAQPGTLVISAGVIAAALCAICFAGSIITTKRLASTETTTCILFWMTLMQIVLGIICVAYDGDVALPSAGNVPLIILVGCCGMLAHYSFTTALKLAPAVIVTPVDFLRLPLIATVGAVFYGELVSVWVIVGAVLVFLANFWNIWNEHRQNA